MPETERQKLLDHMDKHQSKWPFKDLKFTINWAIDQAVLDAYEDSLAAAKNMNKHE